MAITTGKVRASFVNVFQPKAPANGGEPKYSITLLIPKTDTATLNAIYAEIEKAKQEGAQKAFKGAVPPMCKTTLYDGDGLQPSGVPFGEECRGCMVLRTSSKIRPLVVGLDMQPIINPADVYSGCYVRANVNFYAYSSEMNRGISCGLEAVQKIEAGEPLTHKVSAEEAFGGSNAYTGMTEAYSGNTQPQSGYQQPHMSQQQYAYPQQGQQIDPITGKPALAGGVMGIG